MSASGAVFLGSVMDSLTGVLGNFGVHWQLLLIQALNFLCVIAVLYYFAFKPVIRTMEERKRKIEDGLRYTEEMRQKLAQSDVAVQERLMRAKDEAREIIEDAKSQAKNYVDKQKLEIERLTQNTLDSARKSIAEEKASMMRDLKGEVKVLVADIAAKILSKEMTPEDRERYWREAGLEL